MLVVSEYLVTEFVDKLVKTEIDFGFHLVIKKLFLKVM